MATLVSDLRAQLQRAINIPGFEQLPDITNTELDGYIKDGFWEARLLGLLDGYTQTDGTELATPPGEVIKNISDDGDLEMQYQQMVITIGALKMLRLKILNLAINFSAKAGPVEYEQQASATTLRAILASMERQVEEMKALYSDLVGGGAFTYFDGELQRDQALIDGLGDLTVL